MIGKEVGKFVVVSFSRCYYGQNRWNVRCNCGNVFEVTESMIDKQHIICSVCDKHKDNSGRKSLDITGQKFGSLTAIRKSKQAGNREWYWLCRCDCGKEYEVKIGHLRAGTVTRCKACWGKLHRVPSPKNGYPPEFSLDLRKRIRRRDNRTCQYCGKKCGIGELDVHHIDHDRTNNSKSNLVSLCNKCHYMCHHKDSDKWVKYWQEFMNSK